MQLVRYNPSRRQTLSVAGALVASLAAAPVASAQIAPAVPAPAPAPAGERPLAGKVAIVTGARRSIGRGIAVGLAAMGADVLVHYHRPETLAEAEETARLARAAGAPRSSRGTWATRPSSRGCSTPPSGRWAASMSS